MRTEKVVFYKDRTGKHRWKVTGKNGERIAASSEGFERLAGAHKNLLLMCRVLKAWLRGPSPDWVAPPAMLKKGDIVRVTDKRGRETVHVIGKVHTSRAR